MAFRVLGLCLVLMTTLAFANGRGPAVEDFVGIEVEQAEATPSGAEVLYNLEQDLNKIEAQKVKPLAKISAPEPVKESSGFMSVAAAVFLIGLPLMVWFMVMNHLKKKATLQNASNIEVLEKYRKEREKKSEEPVRKVS